MTDSGRHAVGSHRGTIGPQEADHRALPESSEKLYSALSAALTEAVMATTPEGVIFKANAAASELFSDPPGGIVGRRLADLTISHDASAAHGRDLALGRGACWTEEVDLRDGDSEFGTALITESPVLGAQGELAAIVAVVDVTATGDRDQAWRLPAAEAVITLSDSGTVKTCNHAAELLFGYRAQDVVGQQLSLLNNHPQTQQILDDSLRSVFAGEGSDTVQTVWRRTDGLDKSVRVTLSPVHAADGAVEAATIVAQDIGQRRRLEPQTARRALHDALTDLPNEAFLHDRLCRALQQAKGPASLLSAEVDQLENVREVHGHQAGDQLLVDVAERLSSVLRSAETVARISGNEFVLLCEQTGALEAEAIARGVHQALRDPVEVAGTRLFVTLSIGMATSPPLAPDAELLLQQAASARRDAVSRGGARSRAFDPRHTQQSAERLELTNDLREALQQDALMIHYQPVVELTTGRLVGAEALLRWQHHRRGNVPPGLFLPLAEMAGLQEALDRWVLRRACLDAGLLWDQGALPPDGHLAINCSASTASDPAWVTDVVAAASAAGLAPSRLELEVAERGMHADAHAARGVLQSLRDVGVTVALDDFGTGYSSLAYLRQLPVTTLKIDRSFVRNITNQLDDRAIATSILDLAGAVGLRTVAEGVETFEQRDLLVKLGCDLGQGYLWSPAVPLESFLRLAQSNATGSAPPVSRQVQSPARRRRPPQPTREHGLHRLIEMHRDGASVATVAAALNAEGYRTPTGVRWHATSVTRVLAESVASDRELLGAVRGSL